MYWAIITFLRINSFLKNQNPKDPTVTEMLNSNKSDVPFT